MIAFLRERPLLLLFGVAALGYLGGRLKVRGFSLGVAAVLFAGLFVGWRLPGLELPEFVAQLGLVLFVYTLGLASGPGFFASLRARGLRDNAFALAVLLVSALITFALGRVLGLGGAASAGIFAGSLTNTPALAGVVEALKDGQTSRELGSAPVLAYSLCYPLGVLVPLCAVALCARRRLPAQPAEAIPAAYRALSEQPIVSATVCVDRETVCASELRKTAPFAVNFGRIRRGDTTRIVHDDTCFAPGDLVTVVGTHEDVAAAVRALGHESQLRLELDRSDVDYRRMFVSNPEITGRPLRELQLIQRHDAVITRVRRGDVDLIPHRDFELLPGDRARVLAPKERMPELAKLLGDSFRRVAEVDVITFGLGITLGLLLGAVPLPTPTGGTFTLGIAGGPLLVGLLLGRLGRTGPLVWASPYGANLTLRQLGLVLFLAAVGLKAGGSLGSTLDEGAALQTFLAGALVTSVSVSLAIVVGRRLFEIPFSVLMGIIAGIHTQPAVLAFAVEKTEDDLPNVGYASVFPLATIAKILLAQLLLQLASALGA